MIINVEGKKKGAVFEFCLPSLRLDDRISYKIGISHLHFVLENNERNKELHDNELLALSTNLVDRSSLNPSQSALFFPFVLKKHYWQDVRYSSVKFFTLALHEIENASFQILKLHDDEPLSLELFFVQLEIEKDLTHGWVQ